jgi:hypothetical protein
MRSLDTVLAWYRSATYLFNDKRLSSNASLQLTRLECKPFRAYSYDVERLCSESLPRIFPDVEWKTEAVSDLVRRTWPAKIHAEAALMAVQYEEHHSKVESDS